MCATGNASVRFLLKAPSLPEKIADVSTVYSRLVLSVIFSGRLSAVCFINIRAIAWFCDR